jgi:hypothetical protein
VDSPVNSDAALRLARKRYWLAGLGPAVGISSAARRTSRRACTARHRTAEERKVKVRRKEGNALPDLAQLVLLIARGIVELGRVLGQ